MKKSSKSKTKYKLHLPEQAVGVIYAGGHGTRLWPISTKKEPKQINPKFIGHPLIQDAYNRAKKIFSEDKIIIVLTHKLYNKTKKYLKIPKENYLIQPDNADTAAAMGLTALYIESKFPNAVAVTIYSDHFISNISTYIRTIKKGIKIARDSEYLLTIGTKPSFANPEFGYLKKGKSTDTKNLFHIQDFIEKPDKKTAQKLIKSSKYFWNTGVFIWKATTILHLFKQHAPKIYKGLIELKTEFNGPKYQTKLKKWYETVPHQSFETAVTEKTNQLMLLTSNYNWRDVGNWRTIYDLTPKDRNGHALIDDQKSEIISIESQNCLVMPSQKIVSLVGVKDLIIVQTKNDLLVCHKDHVGAVKKVTQKIDDNNEK